jgi:hypothetical protein
VFVLLLNVFRFVNVAQVIDCSMLAVAVPAPQSPILNVKTVHEVNHVPISTTMLSHAPKTAIVVFTGHVAFHGLVTHT